MKAKRPWFQRPLPIATLSVVVGFAGTLYYLARKPTIEKHARLSLQAMLDGDGARYFDYVSERERRAFGVTRETMALVFEKTIRPRLKDFRQVGSMRSEANDDGGQGVAYANLQDSNGHRFEVLSAPYATDTGASASINGALIDAWMAEYVVSKGYPVNEATAVYARVRGLEADMSFLKEAGIKGVISDEGQIIPWESYYQGAHQRYIGTHATTLRSLGIPVTK